MWTKRRFDLPQVFSSPGSHENIHRISIDLSHQVCADACVQSMPSGWAMCDHKHHIVLDRICVC